MIWLLIACGGAIGAVARHLLGTTITARAGGIVGTFPAATFVVNVLGCFAAGILLGIALRHQLSDELRAFLFVGVLGGFTTFSAFGLDTIILLQNGRMSVAAAYAASTLAATLIAVWLGAATYTNY